MRKNVLFLSLITLFGVSCFLSNNTNKIVEEETTFFPAYSYSDDYANEPHYKNGINTSYGTFTQKTTTYDRMNIGSTWNSYRGEKVKVAVIDTGCNKEYEDFSSTNFSSRSYDVVNDTSVVSDTNGHGTDSAACIAAAINGVGGLGISPNVELTIYRAVNSSGGFTNLALQKALRRAIDDHVDIINMSLQGYTTSFSYSYVEDLDGKTYSGTMSASSLSKNTLQSYIDEAYAAGITVVAAAGNYNTTNTSFPAANDHVIGVGSTGLNDGSAKAGFSNKGSYVDVVAPGYVVVPSTSDKAYRLYYGTSFSAPLVTGAIALYKSKYPTRTPDQIEEALFASCDTLTYEGSGWGKVNVETFLNDGTAEEYITPTAMSISSSETISVGATKKISATFTPNNSSRQTCYWSSNNTSIATVDCYGNVKGISQGVATITATSVDGGFISSCTLNVGDFVPVTSIEVSPKSVNLNVTKTQQITASVLPNNATDKTITYQSSDTSICTVSESGLITAIKAGSATITVKTSVSTIYDIITVTITDPRVWLLVNDTSDLVEGNDYVIACNTSSVSAGSISSGYLSKVTTTFSTDKTTMTKASDSLIFNLNRVGDYWNISNTTNSSTKYLGCSAAKSISLSSTSGSDDAYKWTISISEGEAAITAKTNSYGSIKYNSSSPRFTTYTSGQNSIQLYMFAIPGTKSLERIEVIEPKTDYTVGDSFVEPTVKAYYDNGGSSTVSGSTFTNYDLSTTGNQTVNVSYTENSVTKTTSYNITVSPAPIILQSISVKTNPTKMEYVVGEYFDPTGLVLSAHYSDESSSDISEGYTYSPTTKLTLLTTTITITYEGKTTTLTITVTQGAMDTGNANVSKTSFSTTSGSLNTYISYSSSKGNASSSPGIYSNAIRLYQGSSTKYGGYITISANNNRKIRSVVFSTTSASKYAYGTSTSALGEQINISADTDTVLTGFNDSSVVIVNWGTTNTQRLNINKIQVYYWDQEIEATTWATSFLSTMNCDSTGSTPALESNWTITKNAFVSLTEQGKDYLKTASASLTVTDKIGYAMHQYDYIVSKYNFENYIDRSIISQINHLIKNESSETMIAVVTIITLISTSTILAYCFIKKHKYD